MRWLEGRGRRRRVPAAGRRVAQPQLASLAPGAAAPTCPGPAHHTAAPATTDGVVPAHAEVAVDVQVLHQLLHDVLEVKRLKEQPALPPVVGGVRRYRQQV